MSGLDLNLNWNEFDIWPRKVKILIVIALCGVVLGLGVWFDSRLQWQALTDAQKQEEVLKNTFSSKQMKAARLPQYKKHLQEIRVYYNDMVRRLPNKAEIASLLAEISQTGISNNLEFKLFVPETEIPVDFYSELPIKIRVTGKYHDFGRFVADLAALPRIVTLKNVFIQERQGKGAKGVLQMDAVVRTYRYVGTDEEERDEE